MSKTNAIREALTKGPATLETLAERSGLVGAKKIHNLCLYLQKRGEVIIGAEPGAEGVTVYRLGKGKPARKSKRAKKPAGHKRARRSRQGRTLKAIADKFANAAPATDLRSAIIDNLVASAQQLAATLRREVDGVDTNPNLIAAIENSERAAALARAA